MFFQGLNSDHSSDLVELYEVSLGLNKLTFDDAYFQFGFSEATKYFADFLGIRKINEQKRWINYNGSNPMVVFYFGMFEKANNFERFDYDMVEVLGNTGGISDALLVLASITVFYFTDIN